MASLNKVQIIGNLGKDPELNYTPSGMAVCRFSVATTDTWTDKATGERKDKTEWHRIVVFQKLAENCGKYLTKGSPVYVEGKLQTNSYEKDGINRYATDILASAIQFLGQKPQGQQQGYQNTGNNQQRPPVNQGFNPNAAPPQNDQYMYQPPDDDIPF